MEGGVRWIYKGRGGRWWWYFHHHLHHYSTFITLFQHIRIRIIDSFGHIQLESHTSSSSLRSLLQLVLDSLPVNSSPTKNIHTHTYYQTRTSYSSRLHQTQNPVTKQKIFNQQTNKLSAYETLRSHISQTKTTWAAAPPNQNLTTLPHHRVS